MFRKNSVGKIILACYCVLDFPYKLWKHELDTLVEKIEKNDKNLFKPYV